MTNIFENKRCTFYKTGTRPPGSHRLIYDILTNERYTNQSLLNKARSFGYGTKEYNEIKPGLSAATFSSVQNDLSIVRNDTNHLAPTGFIAFDIDAKENEVLKYPGGMDEVKNHIIDHTPFIAYMGTSVSGLGLWGLVPVSHPQRHLEHFEALIDHFASIDIAADSNNKDKSRLRFVAYDPDAHLDFEPDIFEVLKFSDTDSTVTNTIVHERVRKIESEEIFLAACRWVEAKHCIKFQPGYKHNYLTALYSLLRYANVSRGDALNWIYNNLIPAEEVTTNCLQEINKSKKW